MSPSPRRLPRPLLLLPLLALMGSALVGSALVGCAPTETVSTAPSTVPSGWREVAAGPLSARWGAVAAWVDGRFLVVGGSTDQACPPNASCIAPAEPAERDAAAYDPVHDTWARIASAPIPVSGGQHAVIGDDLYLGTVSGAEDEQQFLHYDAAEDRWTELPAPPVETGSFAVAGDRLVAIGSSSNGTGPADAVLDPSTGTWTTLPRDPLGATDGRAATWVGGRLLLFGRPAGTKEATPLRVAQLDGDLRRWSMLRSIPTVGIGATTVGGLVVFPVLGATNTDDDFPYGGVYDPTTQRLTKLPTVAKQGSDVAPVDGVIGTTVLIAGQRLDPATGALTAVPGLPVAPPLYPATATGPSTLLVFGGAVTDDLTNSASGYVLTVAAS